MSQGNNYITFLTMGDFSKPKGKPFSLTQSQAIKLYSILLVDFFDTKELGGNWHRPNKILSQFGQPDWHSRTLTIYLEKKELEYVKSISEELWEFSPVGIK